MSGLTACGYIEDLQASEMNTHAVKRDVWAQEQVDEQREWFIKMLMDSNSLNSWYTREDALRRYSEEREKENWYDFSDYPDIKDDYCGRLSQDKSLWDFMAEKFANQLTGEPTKQVLRITVEETILHTDDDLNCGGTVKWDDSTEDDIQLYRFTDGDGDWWGWRN